MEQPIDPDGDEWEYEYHETETEVCQLPSLTIAHLSQLQKLTPLPHPSPSI